MLAVLDSETLARLPAVSADAFRERFLIALDTAAHERRVHIAQLDPSVRVLVLPRHGKSSDEEIDRALAQVESSAHTLSSVTWSALRDARPPFRPTPYDWAGPHAAALDGDTGVLFFVDVHAIALAVEREAAAAGLSAHIDDDGSLVRVSDGRFHAHVGVTTLIAEALWTGSGPRAALMRRTQQLPHEMRSFVAVLRGLERRFVGVRFEVAGDRMLARRPPAPGERAPPPVRIDYRHWAAGARQSGLALDAYLAGAVLDDLAEQEGELAMLVRSPAYLKAYPDVVCADGLGCVYVAVREEGGRSLPVRAHKDDPPERSAFLRAEAARQLPFLNIDGHAFVVERANATGSGPHTLAGARAYGLVGDKAASILLDPALVRGFCEQLGPLPAASAGRPAAVEVIALSENALVVVVAAAAGADVDLIVAEAKKRAARLETDLFDDGSDALHIQERVELPAVGAGSFTLRIVPDEFFVLTDQALQRSDLGRAHADYLRGLALEALGLVEKAVHSFERAVRARVDDGELNLALGRALVATSEYDRATAVLTRAAAALPEHADAQNFLGVALYRNGAAADARAAFVRAVKLEPDRVSFLVNLGRTCSDERMYDEAKSALERALRVEPASAEAHASMAVLCHRTGDRSRALHHARAALAEQPDDDTVVELLRIMDDDTAS